MCKHGNAITVEVDVAAVKAESTAVPSVSKPESQCVGTRLQFVGHIVGEAFHALVVVGPAWHERVIAYFDAVDFGFHKAECAQIQACALGSFLQFNFGAHQWQVTMVGFRFVPRWSDEIGDMLMFFQESDFEMQSCARFAQRLVACRNRLHGGEYLFT